MDARTRERIIRTVNRAIDGLIAQGKLRRDARGKVRAWLTDVDGTIGKRQLLFSLLRMIATLRQDRWGAIEKFMDAEDAYVAHDPGMEFAEVTRLALEAIPGALKGLKVGEVRSSALQVVQSDLNLIYRLPRALLQIIPRLPAEERFLSVAVTGSPQFIAEPFGAALNLDVTVGCEYFADGDGVLTGERDETPAIRKGEVFRVLGDDCGIDFPASFCTGDMKTDLPGLLAVGRAGRLAVNPKPGLFRHIRENPGDDIVLVYDQRSTGVQFYRSYAGRGLQEVTRLDALPQSLARALPPLLNERPFDLPMDYSWT